MAFTLFAVVETKRRVDMKDISIGFGQNPCGVETQVTETFFGTDVTDPFRCLEQIDSPTTLDWIETQNNKTQQHLATIPYRERIAEKLAKAYDYPKEYAPFEEGNYLYYYANNGKQNQNILYRFLKTDNKKNFEVFLDPNNFSEEGTTSLSQIAFSKDGSHMAYAISEGGSDWRTIVFKDTKTGKMFTDSLHNAKFTALDWIGNKGVFYSKYEPQTGNALTQKNANHQLFYHVLGTPQEDDKLIFSGNYRYVSGSVTEDQTYLVITAANRTSGNILLMREMNEGLDKEWIVIDDDMLTDSYLIRNEGETLYLHTKTDAPNGKVVRTQLDNPTKENWVDLIPESEKTMNATKSGKYIMAQYLSDATSQVIQFNLQGKNLREIVLPGPGTVSGLGAKTKDKHDYFYFGNYITPTSVYKLDLDSGEYETFWTPENVFDSEQYVSEQIFYESQDGTKIPMILSYKKGLKKDGNNPTWLYGYGGFDISLTPSFSSNMAVWMDLGGIFAVANIRGGGEYGKAWHDGGRKLNKKNVFEDFIAAGEYLIDQKYTKKERLAIEGRSNVLAAVGPSGNRSMSSRMVTKQPYLALRLWWFRHKSYTQF
eukprot:maker-scaffold904_size83052-snap-gene-0.1 protein:Tk06173 transcript:maker-scaffold904_size83052-snap-gene-0.1-mRNA-1 annotation:"prolyl endopeptidase"